MPVEADLKTKEVEDGNVEEKINHTEGGTMNNIVKLTIKKIVRSIMKIEEGDGEFKEGVDFKIIEVTFEVTLETLIY